MNGLQTVLQQQQQPPRRSPFQPIEQPEFDVRSGQPLSPSPSPINIHAQMNDGSLGQATPDGGVDSHGRPTLSIVPAQAQPQGEGDAPNSLLRDIGADPGTGLSHPSPSSPSVLSSTPSGTVAVDSEDGSTTPPSNHGSDNDDFMSRIPKIQMPDINSFPETGRIHGLQDRLDQSRDPGQLNWKQKLLKYGLTLGPTLVGALTGGLTGAGSAAGGTYQGLQDREKIKEQQQGELLHEIQGEESSRNTQQGAAASAAHANATMQTNALIRDAMMHSQQSIAQGHDTTRKDVANTGAESRETIAGNKLDEQVKTDKSKMDLQKAQSELATARAKGIPEQIRLAEDRVRIAQQSADASSSRADTQARSLEANLHGTDRGTPIPGAPVVNDQVVGFKPYSATGPTGTTRTKMQQVDAISAVGKTLLTEIDKNKDKLGPFTGRWKNLEEMWGNLPPEAARVAGLQESFASLQPALHQFRSTTAKRDFERRLQIGSFKTNADAMKAGVQAAMDSAEEMKNAWAHGSGVGFEPPKSQPQEGPVEFTRDPKTGKIVRKGQ